MPTQEPFSYNRNSLIETEDTAVSVMLTLFPRVAEAREKLEGVYVRVVEDRSSLRLDDRYLGQWRGGTQIVTAMQIAWDALHTLQSILEEAIHKGGEIPMAALYPILRAAIENSSLAIYLLEPTERDERLRRAYQVAYDDAKLRCNFATSLDNPAAPWTRARTKVELWKLIGTRLLPDEPRSFKFPRVEYSDLVKKAAAAIKADPATEKAKHMSLLAWWQLLSGLSHGRQWAMLEVMARSEAVVDEKNQTANVKMSTPAAAIAVGMLRAVEVLEAALRLYGRRSKDAWAQPEDAYEPPTISYGELTGQTPA